MIVTNMKRIVSNVNKYHKQLWLKLWHLQAKQVEKKGDLYHDSDRDEKCHIGNKKYHKQLWLKLNYTYFLNK